MSPETPPCWRAVRACGAEIAANAEWGVLMTGGTLSVQDAAQIVENGAVGNRSAIRASAGAMTLTGQPGARVALSRNRGHGLFVTAATSVSATQVDILENGINGIELTNGTAQGNPVTLTSCNVTGNAGTALLVHSSPLAAGGGKSLLVEGCTFGGGGSTGIHLAADSGPIAATIRNNVVTGVLGINNVGVLIQGTAASQLEVTGNDVFDNGARQFGPAITLTPRYVGGVLLRGTQPGSWTFTSNRVHANRSSVGTPPTYVDQLAVETEGGPSWSISAPSCEAANLFYCYRTAGPTLYSAVGVASSNAKLEATSNSWAQSPPVENQDFAVVSGGAIDAGDACDPVPSCGP
jgi:hypothetical protein